MQSKTAELDARAIDINKRSDRLVLRELELERKLKEMEQEIERRVAEKVQSAVEMQLKAAADEAQNAR